MFMVHKNSIKDKIIIFAIDLFSGYNQQNYDFPPPDIMDRILRKLQSKFSLKRLNFISKFSSFDAKII